MCAGVFARAIGPFADLGAVRVLAPSAFCRFFAFDVASHLFEVFRFEQPVLTEVSS